MQGGGFGFPLQFDSVRRCGGGNRSGKVSGGGESTRGGGGRNEQDKRPREGKAFGWTFTLLIKIHVCYKAAIIKKLIQKKT